MSSNTLRLIKESQVAWVDLRFTDSRGKEHHITMPSQVVDEMFFENGKMFDGSSIAGWRSINRSDMVLRPDDETPVLDPFREEVTLNLRCDVVEPDTMQNYERDPRSLAKRAEAYLASTGIGDTAYFGPEPEFFIFDEVRWNDDISGCFYAIDSEEAHWVRGEKRKERNLGHRTRIKGGYFPVSPVDSATDLRAAMAQAVKSMGVAVEAHHHEVGTAGQGEIATAFNTLVRKADEIQILKYCVHNVADNYDMTATFMPKPLVGDNGNGMHCHQSITKEGKNIFSGDGYAGLSDEALFYIGGIMRHARALNAFTNPSTNSYRRLVPGFEAPVMLAYSACNRSASIRIPYTVSSKARRIEVRFPDPSANPYLAFSAMLMAGLDGIRNKIHPGDAMDKDLYDLPAEIAQSIPTVATSLEQALDSLDQDREFLKAGEVFNDSLIDGYLMLKRQEVERLRLATHPVEFDLYYSC